MWPLASTWPHLMLVWRKEILTKPSPCYRTVYHDNDARWYEQFLQVTRPPPPSLPPVGHIWDVMLVWRKEILTEPSPCYRTVYHGNDAWWYEQFLQVSRPPPLVTSSWPHLRCDVGLEKGNINKNCLYVTVLCTIIMVHKDTSSSYRSVDYIGL